MTTYCKDCGTVLHQMPEKAIGSGEVQMVWADPQGTWVCPRTDNEHEVGEPRREVEVRVKFGDRESMVRLTLAEFGNFIARPIEETLDDGEASWDMQENDPERHASLAHWAAGLYEVTG